MLNKQPSKTYTEAVASFMDPITCELTTMLNRKFPSSEGVWFVSSSVGYRFLKNATLGKCICGKCERADLIEAGLASNS